MGGYFDYYYGDYYESSTADKNMNAHTKGGSEGCQHIEVRC